LSNDGALFRATVEGTGGGPGPGFTIITTHLKVLI